MRRKRLWPVLLATAISFAILVGLGLWQVQRLKWKTALLADIAVREAAAPVALATVEQHPADATLEFLKVTARGHFLQDQEKLMLATLDGRPGWDVVTPLLMADGKAVLVDRGTVPDENRDPATRRAANPEGEVDVTGLLKMHQMKPNLFTPANNPAANQWLWWDMPALAAGTRLPDGVALLPFVLHVIPGGADYPPIATRTPESGISNNHLQYVVTWFGLAAALLAVAGFYIGGQFRKPQA